MKKKIKRIRWPKKISVGGDVYKVIYATPNTCRALKSGGATFYGCVYGKRKTIFVDKSQLNKGFILFHELLHCAIDSIVTEPELHKEEYVRPISHVLYNSLREAGFLKEGM